MTLLELLKTVVVPCRISRIGRPDARASIGWVSSACSNAHFPAYSWGITEQQYVYQEDRVADDWEVDAE